MGKYERVYQDLSTKIDDGTYSVGSLLPSEKQLTEHYGVSRETARKALALLTNRGYIQKIMGKGSIVINRPQYALPVSFIASYQELANISGFSFSSKVISCGEKVHHPPHIFRSITPSFPTGPYYYLETVHYIDGEPSIIDRNYILCSVVPSIPRNVAEESLFTYLEDTLGLAISYASKQIKIEPATIDDRERLNLAAGEYVGVTTTVTSLEDTTTFQFTESRHRADKFVYQDFARRQRFHH
ncbi:trehalose operon repressor [Rothia sp. P6271]|uniref:trehalose operon repressor n=1 Tax=unclassified Rothia (in: high G+C Gram-positive bacteria) TaxID=2689056 RepID=UPI003AC2F11B